MYEDEITSLSDVEVDNDNKANGNMADSDDVEAIFQRGLMAWEKFDVGTNFKEAKKLIGIAKGRGHPLADMYWDIICSFEEAHEDSL